MNSLDASLFALMVLGFLLLLAVPLLSRRFGTAVGDGVTFGGALLEAGVLALSLFARGTAPVVTFGSAGLVVWIALAWLLFRLRAANDTFPDDDFPGSHCVPQLTHGREIDHTERQWDGHFNKLRVRFRCKPTATNLHMSVHALRIGYCVFFWTETRVVLRHDAEILCDTRCNAGASHIGGETKGSDVLRVQLGYVQLNAGPYVEMAVKMFAAMGAARVVLTGSGTLGSTSGSSAGVTVPVAPGTTATAGATSGTSASLTVGFNVAFPDASLVLDYNCGFFQWQCVPPNGTAVFRLDLASRAQDRPTDAVPAAGEIPSVERPTEVAILTLAECDKPFSLRVIAWGDTEADARFKSQNRGLVDAGLACPGGCPHVQQVSWSDFPTEIAPGVWQCTGVGDYVCRS